MAQKDVLLVASGTDAIQILMVVNMNSTVSTWMSFNAVADGLYHLKTVSRYCYVFFFKLVSYICFARKIRFRRNLEKIHIFIPSSLTFTAITFNLLKTDDEVASISLDEYQANGLTLSSTR